MWNEEIAALLDEGVRLCIAGALDQAEQIFRRLLAARSDVPDAWNLLAMTLFQRGRLDEADSAAQRATRLAQKVPQFWLTRGNIAQARQHFSDAQSCLIHAIELDPALTEAHWTLALSYHREQRLVDAIAAYRQALRLAPDNATIHFQLAGALATAARWDEAVHAYEAAFQRDPDATLDRRGGIDCLEHLNFESVPAFWQTEIARFYARGDIDRVRYSGIVLRVLMTKPALRAAVQAASQQDYFATDTPALHDIMRDVLFRMLLRDALAVDPQLERYLTRLRASLLRDNRLRAQAPLEFLEALALQCLNNEFIFAEDREESATVAILQHVIEIGLHSNIEPTDAFLRSVAVLAMYRPLDTLRGASHLNARKARAPAIPTLLQRTIINMETERELRKSIAVIGSITDEVSRAVRSMYEDHPYPRWFSLDRRPPSTFADWLANQVPRLPESLRVAAAPRILVAGCGTGRDAICLASEIIDAEVLAVDLSLASLGYAQRMAQELGVTNVRFRHGDILQLGALNERFDAIYSAGVLHHMRDPQAGLRVLLGLLRPGGVLAMGLYNERGRSGERAGREAIRQQQLPSTDAAIRAFRRQLLNGPPAEALRPLLGFSDFYSLSMCRDLLFHVQEHEYRLPQIAAILKEHQLKLLGFVEVAPSTLSAHRRMFPGDTNFDQLAHWSALEDRYPEIFGAMYQFWCVYQPG